ncbi:VanW family protein [Bacillus taeanensis]|uniref:Uncharacterized protein n=1 Tax=Bacillus taeanensis TaxID=273032 RepID=A0A366Y178_9BACI|nr:VanW family protein [Bacillus taeanensis]RBW71588.1 hypothetical protein DS031_02240 [Bacillus taeanensis]
MSHSDLKLFVKLFLSILLSVLFIFTFTYAGAYSYEQVISNNKGNEQLKVGSLQLGNTSYKDIYDKVKDHTMRWKTEAHLSLRFQDLIITIPTDVVSFDIEASVKEAMKSGFSPLYVKVNQQTFDEQLVPFQEYNVLANINKEELQNDLITIASSLESTSIDLDLVKYLSKEELLQQTVSEKEITNISSSSTLIKWAESLDGFVIEPESSISMLQMMKQRGLEPVESESLNILAAGIYAAVLPTNFEMIERHIGRKKIPYIDVGYEAKVVPQKKDLVFYNPNTLSYKFQINVSQNMLTVSFVND